MIFTCYAHMKEEAQKRLDKVAKKAARYNVDFSYSVGEEHPERVKVYAIDYVNHVQYEKESYVVNAVDFDIRCDSLVRNEGWAVIAKIEHGAQGNIVTPFTEKIDDSWYNLPAHCDHCNTNRFRSVTFLCEKDGEIRQVGRSCLKDYTGISLDSVMMFVEVKDIFPESLDCSEEFFVSNGIQVMYKVEDIIAYAVECIKSNGYCKSEYPNSTKVQIIDKLTKDEPSVESKAKASEIVEWLKSETFDAYDSIERNCQVLALSGYAMKKHIGRLAYIPVAYDKYIEKKVAEQNRKNELNRELNSNYVGNIGDKITVDVVDGQFVTSWPTQYGYTYLYKMIDSNGNVFVWFASSPCDIKNGVTVKGTVKAHSERDGVKQTVITRCKVC